MNCINCGAALPSNSNLCKYCRTQNEVDLHHVHEYTTEAPITDRYCPHCEIPLSTINIKTQETFYVEQCEVCKGIFCDSGELEALLDASLSNVFVINLEKIKNVNKERCPDQFKVIYIKCPICKEMMHRVNFASSSGVIIDRCKDHGIWLDSGEFKHLLEWRKAGGKLLHEKREIENEKEKKRSKDKWLNMDKERWFNKNYYEL